MDYIIRQEKSKKQKRRYFTEATERAIIDYNNTKSKAKKSKIYQESIHYPFFKLTENIIHTFKFYNTKVSNLEDLQHEIITVLLTKIHLYSHKQNIQDRILKTITKKFNESYSGDFCSFIGDRDIISQEDIDVFIIDLTVSPECFIELQKLTPPKAYSYFGTIIKRWLIAYNKQNYASKIKNISFNTINNSSDDDSLVTEDLVKEIEEKTMNFNENHYLSPTLTSEYVENDLLSVFIDEYILYCTKKIYTIFPKLEEAIIADAILDLFRFRHNIDIFNKKALYINIREKIDVPAPKITKIAKKLHTLFKEKYEFYRENDYFL